MPYLIDRTRALRTTEVVAVLKTKQPRVRSRIILQDNSLYQTLTRPKTLMRRARTAPRAIVTRRRGGQRHDARWRRHP